jgi:hypothetical protein
MAKQMVSDNNRFVIYGFSHAVLAV